MSLANKVPLSSKPVISTSILSGTSVGKHSISIKLAD